MKPTFRKAQKSQAKLRLGLAGPAGGGKTYTALALAVHLGKRIALIDTERGSASLYSDRFPFDGVELEAPFEVDAYVAAINAARDAGYDVLIVDSLSHAWEWLKTEVDRIAHAKFRGNTWAAWSEGTPIQNRLVDAILQYPGHVIVTLRTKTAWETETDARSGKQKPVKIGLAPVQREGLDYEFTIVLSLGEGGLARVDKTRWDAIEGKVLEKPGEKFAKELLAWLDTGAPVPAPAPAPAAAPAATERARDEAAAAELLAELAAIAAALEGKLPEKAAAAKKFINEKGATSNLATLRETVKRARELLEATPAATAGASTTAPGSSPVPAPASGSPPVAGAGAIASAPAPATPKEASTRPEVDWTTFGRDAILARLGPKWTRLADEVLATFHTPDDRCGYVSSDVLAAIADREDKPFTVMQLRGLYESVGGHVDIEGDGQTGPRLGRPTIITGRQLGQLLALVPVFAPARAGAAS